VSGTVTANPEPGQFDAGFTLTANLVVPGNGVAPTGTVQFSINGTAVGAPVTVTSSTATLTVAASTSYTPGSYSLTAAYSGDTNYGQTTLSGTHVVSMLPTTTTLVPTTPLNIYYGQTADGNYTVQVQNSNYPATGTITVYDNGLAVAGCTAIAYGATCPYGDPPEFLSAGTHALTVGYNGDAINAPSLSAPIVYTVLPDITTVLMFGTPKTSPVGQPVTFFVTMTGNFAAPTGTVTLTELFPPTALVTVLGTATLVPASGLTSTATFVTSSLPVGSDTIVAQYAATLDFQAATSNTTVEVITPLVVTATTLTSSVNPSTPGQSVTFTATVAPASSSLVPTGTVTFLDGGATIGTGTLNGAGMATFTTTALALGSHNIAASYPGDNNNAPSTSGVLVQVVAVNMPAAFTLAVTPTPIAVGVGLSGSLAVTVTPVGGFSQPVTLSCVNLPTEAGCTFGESAIPAGGGSTTLQLSTTAPHDCNASQPYFVGSNGAAYAAPVLAGLIALCLPGRRRWLRGILAMVAVGLAMQTTACGTCTDLATRPGTYTIMVTGTASGAQTQSQPVTLTVKL
jgi:Bacterial Ig-like domain (group 3)